MQDYQHSVTMTETVDREPGEPGELYLTIGDNLLFREYPQKLLNYGNLNRLRYTFAEETLFAKKASDLNDLDDFDLYSAYSGNSHSANFKNLKSVDSEITSHSIFALNDPYYNFGVSSLTRKVEFEDDTFLSPIDYDNFYYTNHLNFLQKGNHKNNLIFDFEYYYNYKKKSLNTLISFLTPEGKASNSDSVISNNNATYFTNTKELMILNTKRNYMNNNSSYFDSYISSKKKIITYDSIALELFSGYSDFFDINIYGPERIDLPYSRKLNNRIMAKKLNETRAIKSYLYLNILKNFNKQVILSYRPRLLYLNSKSQFFFSRPNSLYAKKVKLLKNFYTKKYSEKASKKPLIEKNKYSSVSYD